MKLIFAVDKNYSIGYEGEMLFHLRKDLKRFREITLGNILIMGRKTLESLPHSKALEGRINIVLTRDGDYFKENTIVLHSIDQIGPLLEEINGDGKKEVFLIGGGNLVKQLYDSCTYAYITEVDKEYKDYDTKIPNISKDPNWIRVSESDLHRENDLTYRYVEYKRLNL